jgi:hypothetical protein
VVGHDLLLSTATHTDGRRAITLMNWDGVFTAAPTIVIPSATVNTTASPTKLPLIEIDPITGHEVLAVDVSVCVCGCVCAYAVTTRVRASLSTGTALCGTRL